MGRSHGMINILALIYRSCMGLVEGFGSVLFMKGPSSDATDKYEWSGPRETLTELSRRPSQRSPLLLHPKVRERTTGTIKAAMDLTTNWISLRGGFPSQASSVRVSSNVPVQRTHFQQVFDRSMVHVAQLQPVPVLFTTEHLTGEPSKTVENRTRTSITVDLELIRHKLRLAVLRSSRHQQTSRLKKPRVGRRKRAPKGINL